MDSREARSLGMTAGPAWGRAGIATMSPEMRKRLGLAAAQFGTALVPSTGMTEFTGQMPDFSTAADGTAGVAKLPGFTENVAKGNYLDAFMQTLGAAGDAAQATAPLTGPAGLAFGAAIKAPKGLANAIKVFGATGQKAKQIEAGIAKLNAGKSPTPAQLAAVEEASRGGLAQARNAITKQNPDLKGAPPHIASMADHTKLVDELRADMKTGAANKDWYPQSSSGLAESFAGDPERQSRITRAAGIASQQTPVGRDAGIAYRGMINAEYYGDQTPKGFEFTNPDSGEVTATPWSTGHMYNAVGEKVMSTARGFDPEPTGGKIGPYTANLLTGGKDPTPEQIAQYPWMQQHLDAQGRLPAVADTIMHQRFQYPDSAKASSTSPYITRALREADGTNRPASGPQAEVWLAQQQRMGGSGNYNLRDAINEMTGLMNVETTLGSNTKLERAFRTAEMPYDERIAFDTHMSQAWTDEAGRSEILKMAGLPQMNPTAGVGAFEGQFNPVRSFYPVTPGALPGKTGAREAGLYTPRVIANMEIPSSQLIMPLDDTAARALTMATLTQQKMGFQKGLGWIKPFVDNAVPLEKSDYLQVNIGRPLTMDESMAFDQAGLGPIARGQGAAFLVFDGNTKGAYDNLTRVADQILGDGKYDVAFGPSQRFYNEHDWTGDADATEIDKAVAALGPEFGRRARDIQQAIAPKLFKQVEEWGKANGASGADFEDTLRTIERWAGGAGQRYGLAQQAPSQKLGVASPGPQQRPGLARPYDPFALED